MRAEETARYLTRDECELLADCLGGELAVFLRGPHPPSGGRCLAVLLSKDDAQTIDALYEDLQERGEIPC